MRWRGYNKERTSNEIHNSVFERLRFERGLPQWFRVDNGPEFPGADFVIQVEAAGMVIPSAATKTPNSLLLNCLLDGQAGYHVCR